MDFPRVNDFLAAVAKFPLLLNVPVARRLSFGDVESSRHDRGYGDVGGKLNSVRNIKKPSNGG